MTASFGRFTQQERVGGLLRMEPFLLHSYSVKVSFPSCAGSCIPTSWLPALAPIFSFAKLKFTPGTHCPDAAYWALNADTRASIHNTDQTPEHQSAPLHTCLSSCNDVLPVFLSQEAGSAQGARVRGATHSGPEVST